VLTMSELSMRISPLYMLSISIHLRISGIATKVEYKKGATEVLMSWPELGLVTCTKLFQTNGNG
jgi:hypothetical protein